MPSTTLVDVNGVEHEYRTTRFGYDQGFRLLNDLAEMLGDVLGAGVASLILGVKGKGLDLDTDVDVDFGKLGGTIALLPRLVASKGGPEFVARILERTERAREMPGPDGYTSTVWDKLSAKPCREASFGDGNLFESFEAAAWVIEVNFAPFLRAVSLATRKRFGWLEGIFAVSRKTTNGAQLETRQSEN